MSSRVGGRLPIAESEGMISRRRRDGHDLLVAGHAVLKQTRRTRIRWRRGLAGDAAAARMRRCGRRRIVQGAAVVVDVPGEDRVGLAAWGCAPGLAGAIWRGT